MHNVYHFNDLLNELCSTRHQQHLIRNACTHHSSSSPILMTPLSLFIPLNTPKYSQSRRLSTKSALAFAGSISIQKTTMHFAQRHCSLSHTYFGPNYVESEFAPINGSQYLCRSPTIVKATLWWFWKTNLHLSLLFFCSLQWQNKEYAYWGVVGFNVPPLLKWMHFHIELIYICILNWEME